MLIGWNGSGDDRDEMNVRQIGGDATGSCQRAGVAGALTFLQGHDASTRFQQPSAGLYQTRSAKFKGRAVKDVVHPF